MKTLLLLVGLIIIISCVLMLARSWVAERARQIPPADNPKEILRRRYAAGEIDEEEYLRRMSGLSQDW
ncbi:SHOCT domain-containing protein [Sphaerisporangium dianthi]|uniref:SHOCT domain-containing protein n=1 Tax=Sphaerisporangium dianthi TaxID=1436120 RepID=A0ABV9CE62_9ACTN